MTIVKSGTVTISDNVFSANGFEFMAESSRCNTTLDSLEWAKEKIDALLKVETERAKEEKAAE